MKTIGTHNVSERGPAETDQRDISMLGQEYMLSILIIHMKHFQGSPNNDSILMLPNSNLAL